ncbi:MAG: methionine--tRNA ligase subunit beta, partial [Proteiniphilum sp.]
AGKHKAQAQAQPVKENIQFDTFEKLDIRVGTVLECEKVPKTDKLLRFLLDDGLQKRTILSGIAAWYPNPSELVGKQVCFIANLEPRKMRGVLSEGMILSAENSDGSLALISPSEMVLPGSRVV